MKINPLIGALNQVPKFTEVKGAKEKGFENVFTNFIQQVNSNQISSKEMTKKFIEGDDIEIHEVMIAGQKAKTSIELLMEIRNKTVDMWKQLSRLQ